MTYGARLDSVVMFVHELDRSVSFYLEVLGLRVADRSSTAALLLSPHGSQLILRAMGTRAAHALGTVGVQYVIWTAAGEDDLSRCEQALRSRRWRAATRTASR